MKRSILSNREKLVATLLEWEAETPYKCFEEETSLTASGIRSVAKDLIDRQILRFYPFVNPFALGLSPISIFCKLKDPSPEKILALARYASAHPSVTWCASFGGGEFDLAFTLLCRSVIEVAKFIEDLSTSQKWTFEKKTIFLFTSLSIFQVKYLAPRSTPSGIDSWDPNTPAIKINSTDMKILSAVVNLEYRSRRELAVLMKFPLTTLQRRIQKLIRHGVIRRFMYYINAEKIGFSQVKALVTLRSVTREAQRRFTDICRHHPYVTMLLWGAGEWDCQIGLEVPRNISASNITTALYRELGKDALTIQVLPVLAEHKVSCFPFNTAALNNKSC